LERIRRAITARTLGLTLLIGLAVLTIWIVSSLTSDRPVEYGEITEHVRYGSIGSEPGGSAIGTIMEWVDRDYRKWNAWKFSSLYVNTPRSSFSRFHYDNSCRRNRRPG
jgi:hypothetical protein